MLGLLMTVADQILAGLSTARESLAHLTPAELTINSFVSLCVLAGALAAAGLMRWGLRRGVEALPGPADAEKQVRTSRVRRLAKKVGQAGLIALAFYLIARVWGLDPMAWASAGVGERLTQALVRLALIGLLMVAAFEFAALAINRFVGRVSSADLAYRRSAQLKTLAPLLRGLLQSAVILIGGLMMLSEVGVQVGPLLAGAGVVGIAIGFGAQTFVKDVLTGVFLIVEDIVSVGDIVRVGDSGGLVEAMTLRTIRLRDFDGTLHVFPYGEAQVVHNLTRDFSYYVFDLQIAYEAEIDQAIEVMRTTGERLQADPTFSPMILAPIEVVGVDRLADSGVVLKARIKTRPFDQWTIGREYNRRIKLAFDEAKIEIPYPHLRLVWPPGPQPAGGPA